MGKGIELARAVSPEHAAAIDDLKDQLLILFLKRLGGSLDMTVEEIDSGSRGYLFAFNIDPVSRVFHFNLRPKQ